MTIERQVAKQLILDVVSELTDVDLSAVPETADLFEVGLDSLGFATIVVEVEERLGEDLPAEVFDAFDEIEVFSLSAVLDALTAASPAPS